MIKLKKAKNKTSVYIINKENEQQDKRKGLKPKLQIDGVDKIIERRKESREEDENKKWIKAREWECVTV